VRVNENAATQVTFDHAAFDNELIVADAKVEDPFPLAAIWRWLVEIETSVGPLLIQIPTYDEHVQEFIAACTSGQIGGKIWSTPQRGQPMIRMFLLFQFIALSALSAQAQTLSPFEEGKRDL
jgi:hypothetical protein